MEVGIVVRNMGNMSTKKMITYCAEQAELAGLDHIWTVDHIAIPPEQSEGSEGRYLDALATLAYLAGRTTTIKLGVSVLVLPYRPPLPTAKWIATIQELSSNRLILGVGPGWMEPEYKALGVEKKRRGKLTDIALNQIMSCFGSEDDIVTLNEQQFLFRPNPISPPIFVGGMTEKALERVVSFGSGWLPIGVDPTALQPKIASLKKMLAAVDKKMPKIITIGDLPTNKNEAEDNLSMCRELGVTGYISSFKYTDEASFQKRVEDLRNIKKNLRM